MPLLIDWKNFCLETAWTSEAAATGTATARTTSTRHTAAGHHSARHTTARHAVIENRLNPRVHSPANTKLSTAFSLSAPCPEAEIIFCILSPMGPSVSQAQNEIAIGADCP